MTLEHAMHIRAQQLQGKPVHALDLQDAVHTIQLHRPRPKGGRPPKFRLPTLRPADREVMNAMLLYRLGMAMGRIEERKAA